jgi:hypothetical protein
MNNRRNVSHPVYTASAFTDHAHSLVQDFINPTFEVNDEDLERVPETNVSPPPRRIYERPSVQRLRYIVNSFLQPGSLKFATTGLSMC